MSWFQIYRDSLTNLLLFLCLDLFVNYFTICKNKEKQFPVKISFLLMWIVFSIIPTIPCFIYISLFANLLYTFLITKGRHFSRFLAFLKYEIYYYLGSVIITVLHTLFTMDFKIFAADKTYADYANIIDCFMLYAILNMYIILKKLSGFSSGKIYKRYFLAITGGIGLSLIVCSMIFGSTIISQENVVPFMFFLLLAIALLCLSIYHKIVHVLEENILTKIEVEKNALQKDYYSHIEENLKTLSLLRHDFKNHLIIIQGYANEGKIEKLQSYVQSLHDELTPTVLIDTPSQTVSSIINAKNEDCKHKGISFTFNQSFKSIAINDFYLVSILSNLLDNAITAAAKCEKGYVRLEISEAGSYLKFDCTNNHMEQIMEKNNIFQTTKTTQKEIHGLGITSMRRNIEKLRGKINIDYTENTFHVNIMLPNYK